MIANGLVMLRFVYLIQVYGNASEYLLRFLQVLQTKVARIVTRLSWDTGTDMILSQVGWLSIQQLYVYSKPLRQQNQGNHLCTTLRIMRTKNLSIVVLNIAKYTIISLILTDNVPIFFRFNLFQTKIRGSFRF